MSYARTTEFDLGFRAASEATSRVSYLRYVPTRVSVTIDPRDVRIAVDRAHWDALCDELGADPGCDALDVTDHGATDGWRVVVEVAG